MLMALTGKKLLFANAVLAGSSNGEAAISAGYSMKTAPQAGSRLVKDPAVVAYLAAYRQAAPAKDESAPPAPPAERPAFDLALALAHADPRTFLLAAMNDLLLDPKQRIDAAKALMPFTHQKLGEGGKKDQKNEKAKEVASRFAPAAPPRLAAAGGKKV
jgi:phage terminase small subunit